MSAMQLVLRQLGVDPEQIMSVANTIQANLITLNENLGKFNTRLAAIEIRLSKVEAQLSSARDGVILEGEVSE